VASDLAYAFYGLVSLAALARVTGIAMRTLAVPTRAELEAYRAVFERAVVRLRRG
jgi:hypothetical protein